MNAAATMFCSPAKNGTMAIFCLPIFHLRMVGGHLFGHLYSKKGVAAMFCSRIFDIRMVLLYPALIKNGIAAMFVHTS